MNDDLYDRLVEAARGQQTVTYSELAQMLKLDMANPNDRRRIGELLGEISRHEVERGRPMLSSVVLHKDGITPGRGFFDLGVELGKVPPSGDELTFTVQQLKATFEYWARHSGGIGRAQPSVNASRAAAEAGMAWYELDSDGASSVSGMVMVDQGGGNFTAFDVQFEIGGPMWATFVLDISANEAISPGSSAPSFGWVGWLNGDVVLAWQNPDVEVQGTAEWPRRSPFDPDEDDGAVNLEAFGRLAAAIQRLEFDDLEGAFDYLPERTKGRGLPDGDDLGSARP